MLLLKQVLRRGVQIDEDRLTGKNTTSDRDRDRGEITVLYNGEPYDPAETMNDLSFAMLKNAITDMRHETVSEGEYTNRIKCGVRG